MYLCLFWSVLMLLITTISVVVIALISKKDSSLRHTELLSHISPAVTTWLSANCRQLMSEHLKHSLVLSIISHCNSMSLSLVALFFLLYLFLLIINFSLLQLLCCYHHKVSCCYRRLVLTIHDWIV